jgi:hypothetical protein
MRIESDDVFTVSFEPTVPGRDFKVYMSNQWARRQQVIFLDMKLIFDFAVLEY